MSNLIQQTKNLYKIVGIITFIYIFTIFTNGIPDNLQPYLSNLYIQFGLIVLIYTLYYHDKYIGTLAFILFTLQFRFAYKEYFESGNNNSYDILSERDNLKKAEMMRQIKASLDFNYNKPEDKLKKETILSIYNKFLGIDELKQLLKIDNNAKEYKVEL